MKKNNGDNISTFESLMLVLSGRIGVGSISGIALALYYGGIGSIFWICIISLIALPITFAESTLGSKYKVLDTNNYYLGGPSYYIEEGLKLKYLAIIYSLTIIISYVIGFLMIQSNTITKSLNSIIRINPYIIGVIISIFISIIIFGGIKKISNFTSKIIPYVLLIYILLASLVLLKNINILPKIVIEVLKSAFSFKSGISGFIYMVYFSIQRSIFSSEVGLGTGAIASSVSNTTNYSSVGYIQMIGVYITTFLVCISTSIIVLTTNFSNLLFNDLNGIELVYYAFNYHFNIFGKYILLIFVIIYCITTILSGYYDGEASLKYLFNKNKISVLIFRICTILLLFLGCIIKSSDIWNFTDTIIGFLGIINIYAIYRLRKEVKNEYNRSRV